RLEVNYDGEWGTVCDAQFSAKSAFVVCNSLGFIEGGVRRTARSKGLGPIWMKNVQCAGKESDIGDCPKTCGGHGCSHQNDVGICCWG
ncbi:SRCR-like domain-containing protein, partial [Baffinella frigidus]